MGMKTEHLEAARFQVHSGSNSYLVDLASYDGNGECGCQHFEHRCRPVVEGTRPAAYGPEDTRCKHIRAARNLLADMAINKLNGS